jgi:hypothetical protein
MPAAGRHRAGLPDSANLMTMSALPPVLKSVAALSDGHLSDLSEI